MLTFRLQRHISRQVLKIFNLQIADVVWKETVNIVFHFSISSFCIFYWFNKSLLLHVSRQCMNSFCLYFDSRRIHELDFLLQRLACSSLTPRWFIEALRCINDLIFLLFIFFTKFEVKSEKHNFGLFFLFFLCWNELNLQKLAELLA